jgi:Helix-turn-helix domain
MSEMVAKTKGGTMKDWNCSVSNSLVRDASVSAMARFTYIVLMGFEDNDGTAPAFPGLKTLERILGRDREAVQRYNGELERAGWIKKERVRNKSGQFQSIRYRLHRHRSGKMPLWKPQAQKTPTAPKRQKPQPEKPQPENAASISTQSYQFPSVPIPTERIVRARAENTLPQSIASILATPDNRVVFDPVDWFNNSLKRILGPWEWKKNEGLWQDRAHSGEASAKALRNATEDFFILSPYERAQIRNRAAWITDRYVRGFDKLKAS